MEDDQVYPYEEEWQDDPQTHKDRGHGENPSEENLDNTQNELSATPIDQRVGDNRKKIENYKIRHKKRKANKSTGIVILTSNKYTLLMEVMGEITTQILNQMNER